jgi:NADH-quinone oxidoreductase subunit C
MTVEQVRDAALQAAPGAAIEIIPSTPAAEQPALLVDAGHVVAVAEFLKADPQLQMDFCSCVTGVDYLKQNYIEVVYHLYSVAKKLGPVILKVRAPREPEHCQLPSLTPVWRGCEYQEREAFDLYGVRFEGHSDLRRILMWDEFVGFPMRKDYVAPTDYEWEPTPHDETLKRAKEAGGLIPPSAAATEAKK